MDVLTAIVKPAVASGLGYSARLAAAAGGGLHAGDYYTHARNLYLITRTLEERLALVPSPVRGLRRFVGRRAAPPVAATELDGFRIVGAQLLAASRNVFRDDPHRLMRAFLYMQQRGLTLHPDLAQLLRPVGGYRPGATGASCSPATCGTPSSRS
jgi:UTP:GlnB (protein PII) uridylyltransferase